MKVSYTPDLDWEEGWQAADILAEHWAHLDRTQDIVRQISTSFTPPDK